MKISILCTDKSHPVYPCLKEWQRAKSKSFDVVLVNSKKDIPGGDILFLISCNEIVGQEIRNKYQSVLVVHASDLPHGRGWSPHIWQVLEGRNDITVSLLEAEDAVDTGSIWAQRKMHLEGHELYDEINAKLFQTEIELMEFAVANFKKIQPLAQSENGVTYYARRTPEDSRLDPNKTIAEQFNLLRVADPERFPAFFDWKGHKYQMILKKTTKRDS